MDAETGMRRVTLGRSRVRESRTPGSVTVKAEWLSYSTTIARRRPPVDVVRQVSQCQNRHSRPAFMPSFRQELDESSRYFTVLSRVKKLHASRRSSSARHAARSGWKAWVIHQSSTSRSRRPSSGPARPGRAKAERTEKTVTHVSGL